MIKRSISIVNNKGGTGKTTTTINVAAALAKNKRKVLVIDLDMQRNATEWLGNFGDENSIYEVIVNNADMNQHICSSRIENIDIVPASRNMISIEIDLAKKKKQVQTILRDKINSLNNSYDYVLIDCPPTLGFMTINALAGSKEVLIPVEASILALKGVAQILETIDAVQGGLNPELKLAGVVVTRVNKQTRHAKDAIQILKKRFDSKLFKTAIRENIRLKESPGFQMPINEYDRRCNGTKDYQSLAREVMKQEGK